MFLSFPFFFFLSSPTAKTGGRIYTIYTSNDADSPKDVPFGGFDDKKTLFRVSNTQNTPKMGVVKQFQNFQAKSKKNWNCCIFNRVNQINTKFERWRFDLASLLIPQYKFLATPLSQALNNMRRDADGALTPLKLRGRRGVEEKLRT